MVAVSTFTHIRHRMNLAGGRATYAEVDQQHDEPRTSLIDVLSVPTACELVLLHLKRSQLCGSPALQSAVW
jgi:hypothetical protein